MKKLAVKRRHEKVVLAVIILSCGLVLQADPPARQHQQGPQQVTQNWQRSDDGSDAHVAKPAKHVKHRELQASR